MADKAVLVAIIGGISTIVAATVAIIPSFQDDDMPPVDPSPPDTIVVPSPSPSPSPSNHQLNSEIVLPTRIPDLSGFWNTNIPNIVYKIEQSGSNLHWSIPGTNEQGTARIEGNKYYAKIGTRMNVEFYMSRFDENGRPIETLSNDPEYKNLRMFRD